MRWKKGVVFFIFKITVNFSREMAVVEFSFRTEVKEAEELMGALLDDVIYYLSGIYITVSKSQTEEKDEWGASHRYYNRKIPVLD